MKTHFKNLAKYNQWANIQLYRHLSELNSDLLFKESGAFFSSAFLTFHHILNGDLIWLHRFCKLPCDFDLASAMQPYPVPNGLATAQYTRLEDLYLVRENIDKILILWIEGLSEDCLQKDFAYKNIAGELTNLACGELIAHLFNHQTHHRGQITTLLSQMGDHRYSLDYLRFIKYA